MPGGITIPVEVLLSWPTPNYIDPPTRGRAILFIACIFGSLSLATLLARLWVRIKIQNSAGWDDWLMMAAMFPLIALTVIFPLLTERHEFNRHVWDVHPNQYVVQRKIVLTIETTFCLASGLIKISILLFYRRLSSRVVSPAFRWATWISIGFIAAYSIAFIIVPIFGCNPISAYWDQVDLTKRFGGYKYKCFNEGADVFAAGVISTFQDLITALLPTFLYWNLQIPRRQKIALFGVFAVGYGVVAIGALRSYWGWYIFFRTYDVTWYGWDNTLWTMLELHVGALCANAPALKVFFKQTLRLDKLTSWSRNRSNHTHQNSNSRTGSKFATSSTLDKFSFWKHSHSSSRGYLSEPHTNTAVDALGGVQKNSQGIQKSVTYTTESDSKRDSRSDPDIEMQAGNWDIITSESQRELEALPQLPSRPASTRALKSAKTSRVCEMPLRLPVTARERQASPYPYPSTKESSGWRPWV